MKCAFCGQSTYKNGRFYHRCSDGKMHIFCSKSCAKDFEARLHSIRERYRKQTIAEREQLRLLEWFS